MSKYFDGEKLSGYEESPITYVYGGNLEECHNKISDLEAKLAEAQGEIEGRKNLCYLRYKQLETQDKEIKELKQQLAEKERQYETLYKLFSEQHEIIDQNELECFEEVSRLLKEQKDFYVVEKTEYDKMKQGAKDIVNQLKQQLAEKEKEIETLKAKLETAEYWNKKYDDCQQQLAEKEKERELDNSFWKQECDSLQKTLTEKEKLIDEYADSLEKLLIENADFAFKSDQSKTEFAIQQLQRVKEIIQFKPPMQTYEEIIKTFMFRIDEIIKELEEE